MGKCCSDIVVRGENGGLTSAYGGAHNIHNSCQGMPLFETYPVCQTNRPRSLCGGHLQAEVLSPCLLALAAGR